MESARCYHCGVYFALKAARIHVMLLNPAKSKSISSHKTNERDAIWLLRLAETRLIERSYIPDDKIFELRILTRRRMKIADTIANLKKSLMLVLETMGVKIRVLQRILEASALRGFLMTHCVVRLESIGSKILLRSFLTSFRSLAQI